MSRINGKIAVIIILFILVMIAGLFIKTPVNTQTPYSDSQVGGLFIQFKDRVSESEVKAILQNINMTRNYRMRYDTNTSTAIPKYVHKAWLLNLPINHEFPIK